MATQTTTVIESAKKAPAQEPGAKRYLALDAYRGFIMFVLVSGGFGLRALARNRPAFAWIANQFDHRPWEWIAFWDLIQPAFMFMVGVAMPFAIAIRRAQRRQRSRTLPAHCGAQSPADPDEPDSDVDLVRQAAFPTHQRAGADRAYVFPLLSDHAARIPVAGGYRGGAPDRPLGAVCGVPRHGRPIPLEDDQYRRGDR